MSMSARHVRLIQHKSLRHFFQDSVTQAIKNQHIDTDDGTIVYLTNLLTVFTRSENLFEPRDNRLHIKPLALQFKDALNASSTHERSIALQRLGDIALFVSGIFSHSLARQAVDVDYYVNMGGSAYSYLADTRDRRLHNTALGEIFSELAAKFVDFVDVLSEVCEKSHAGSDKDLLRLYEVWIRTGSKRTEQLLREHGIHLDNEQLDKPLH